MEAPFVRPPWWRESCPTIIEGESMTQECHAEACDINEIVARFQRTGMLPPGSGEGVYGDVTALQGDPTELWLRSRSTLERAETFRKEWEAKQAAGAAKEPPEAPKGVPPAAQPPAGGTPPTG